MTTTEKARPAGDTAAGAECRFQLQRLLIGEGAEELLAAQPWAFEGERWAELVFAVLAELTDLPQTDLRALTGRLDGLGLTGIALLAQRRDSDEGRANARHLTAELTGAGVPADTAARAAGGLHEIAAGLARHFGARLQRYLRHYGEMMLDDLGKWFDLDAITRPEAANAFTYWLQNAVLMPLSNIDAPLRAFCAEIGATPADLVAAADDLGVNLSLLDDLVMLREAARDPERVQDYLGLEPDKGEGGA